MTMPMNMQVPPFPSMAPVPQYQFNMAISRHNSNLSNNSISRWNQTQRRVTLSKQGKRGKTTDYSGTNCSGISAFGDLK